MLDSNPGMAPSIARVALSAMTVACASPHAPHLSEYGAYCTRATTICFPLGARCGQRAEGEKSSTCGSGDISPYFAASAAFWSATVDAVSDLVNPCGSTSLLTPYITYAVHPRS